MSGRLHLVQPSNVPLDEKTRAELHELFEQFQRLSDAKAEEAEKGELRKGWALVLGGAVALQAVHLASGPLAELPERLAWIAAWWVIGWLSGELSRRRARRRRRDAQILATIERARQPAAGLHS